VKDEKDDDSDGRAERVQRLRDSYDRVALEYVTRLIHELDYKPLDRALLAALVEEVPSGSIIADVGAGPDT
jgi:hypothetical protein